MASKRKKRPGKTLGTRHQNVHVMLMHQMILSGSYPNATHFWDKLGIKKRTVLRHIKHMREDRGLPIGFDSVKNGYFYTEPVAEFMDIVLTDSDVFYLMMARVALNSYHGAALKHAMAGFKKLAALLPEEIQVQMEDLDQIVSFDNSIQTIYSPKILEAYVHGVRHDRQLLIHYHTPGKEPGWRIIDPYWIRYIRNDWYIFAFDYKNNMIVKFVPQRTLEVKETGKTFERPKGLTLDKFLAGSFGVFSNEGNFDVIIYVNKKSAHRIREKRWPGQQKIVDLPDGGLELHLKLTSLVEVHLFVLEFDGDAFPVAPQELKEKYLCNHQKTGANIALMQAYQPAG